MFSGQEVLCSLSVYVALRSQEASAPPTPDREEKQEPPTCAPYNAEHQATRLGWSGEELTSGTKFEEVAKKLSNPDEWYINVTFLKIKIKTNQIW